MHKFVGIGLLFAALAMPGFNGLVQAQEQQEPFQLIVMDPLSAPLSCDCVKGYAQRKYELLGKFLSKKIGRKVNVTWHESLSEAVKETKGKFDLVIGKHSVVQFDANKLKRPVTPIARLTGKNGEVVQQGLIVVRQNDPAKKIEDLAGYQIYFGPEEAEEKSSAPKSLLKKAGVKISSESKSYGACSEAAVALMKLSEDVKAAAVISSYAEPLLEGCGSIQKGDLRILARTDDVPFVTAFIPSRTNTEDRKQLEDALALVATDSKLLTGLETLIGFEPWESNDSKPDTDDTSAGQEVEKKKTP